MYILKETCIKNISLDEQLKIISSSTNEKTIESTLETINNYLLSCTLKVGKKTFIEPYWIEAYCFKTEYFEDHSCHQTDAQKQNRKLYFHPKGQAGKKFKHGPFRGIDIALSDGTFYLAFLLKFNKINEKYYKECASSWAIANGIDKGKPEDFEELIKNNGTKDVEINENNIKRELIIYKTFRKGLGIKAHGKVNKNFMVKSLCSFKLDGCFRNTRKYKNFIKLFDEQNKINFGTDGKEVKKFINKIYNKFTSFFDIEK